MHEDLNDAELLQLFIAYGQSASYHYADDSTDEWSLGDKKRALALEVFDANPHLHSAMYEAAKGFLWSLSLERSPKIQRTHQPKGSMCMECVYNNKDCSGLKFEDMKVIGLHNNIFIVQCQMYKKKIITITN